MSIPLPKPSGPYVDLRRFDSKTESYEIVARCVLVGDRVEVFGDEDLVETLSIGVRGYPDGFLVTPEHGEEFLNSLKYYFRTPYLNATDIQYVNNILELNRTKTPR